MVLYRFKKNSAKSSVNMTIESRGMNEIAKLLRSSAVNGDGRTSSDGFTPTGILFVDRLITGFIRFEAYALVSLPTVGVSSFLGCSVMCFKLGEASTKKP